ncbi:helix-turn-helix transcriptional regulator [Streptomyces sp. SPB162]|uniref:AAA family ATPase n=1 Tax=Streptomyces sp. SPB162 TaxID=2940560 RepID=UPI002406404D|nr:helix-turn-helix transcriptional regulator [Streptomyces sp. SPB162]MDF9812015.1 DNA-binding CsgD family transcriptional regulator [Streptomyces sp. SPB162]
MLHGRTEEQSAIGDLLSGARAGRSGVLVLRGEAGIGKTALLDDAVDTVATTGALTVVRGSGTEFEAELPFAGIQLLLRPAMGSLGALPEPQRLALEAAFGMTVAAAPDPMFVGLAVLSLLSAHSGDGPLLCVVDDAQWLDRVSTDALMFAARRLDAEGIALVFAARDGEGTFPAPGLPELRLRGLAPASAAALLAGQGAELSPNVRHRVLTEAQGNPLALLELPVAFQAERPDGRFRPGALPLTSRLHMAFHGRVSHLPAATRLLLLVAAAEHTGDLRVVLRAAQALGAGAGDLPPAQEGGLIRLDDDRLRFRHPLVRAAVYQRAPLADRLIAHQALAGILDAPQDADRRAWHLAAAAPGPDEATAAALEDTAGRARDRSGYAAAALAFERAARLSTDPGAGTRRLTLAAEAAAEAGELDRARDFAEQAARRAGDPALTARLHHVRALANFLGGSFPTAHRLLTDGAAHATAADPERAARMLMQAAHTAWYLGEQDVADTVARLDALELPATSPVAPVARFITAALGPPTGDGPPDLTAAVTAARVAGPGDPRDLMLLCGAGLAVGQDDEAHELAAALAAESRELGAIGRLPTVLFFMAEAEVFAGRHRDALATAQEALRIAGDTGQQQWTSQFSSVLAYLAAVEGDEERCRRYTAGALAVVAGAAMPPGAPWSYWAQGMLDLGLGRAQAALDGLERLTHEPLRHHFCATRSIPDLIEAAVRLGLGPRAAEPLARFERWAARTRQSWSDALVLRCRALLAADSEAEAHFTAALKLHDEHRRPLEHARTALLYGEWLRRARRKSEARGHLRSALDVFERLGSHPWADRARSELGATGTAAPRSREPGVLAGLTPQELQIARFAAQGMSNRDIAARLFLSPRTVGYHLYKAYPKLDIASRGELAALFE